jgi:DHA3 family macrolide efflux protein-like MFS transporter
MLGWLRQGKNIRLYLDMLRHRHLSLLWASQVLSAIGDQLHGIAVLWISVQVGGAKAGFVVAAGTIAGLAVGLLGGVYADRWNRRITMVVVDVIRAIAVLYLAWAAHVGTLQLWQMAAVAIVCSSVGSLFDPCLSASIPMLTNDPMLLRAMNSLMAMTYRIARVLGPGVAGLLLAFCPISAFFAIDSLTFLVSAYAIWLLGSNYPWKTAAATTSGARGILADLRTSGLLIWKDRELLASFALGSLSAFIWPFVFVVGLPMLVNQKHFFPTVAGVETFSAMIFAYGIGNVLSNLFVGTLRLSSKSTFYCGLGLVILGAGFGVAALAPNFWFACAGLTLAAMGGPIGDLATVWLIQSQPNEHQGKINSFARVSGAAGFAVGLLVAPFIFEKFAASSGIAMGAAVYLVAGVIGIIGGLRIAAQKVVDERKLNLRAARLLSKSSSDRL